jgi:hypothetical protein
MQRLYRIDSQTRALAASTTAISMCVYSAQDPFFEENGPSPIGSCLNYGSHEWGGTFTPKRQFAGQSAAGEYALNEPLVALLHELFADIGKRNKRASAVSSNMLLPRGIGGGRVDWCEFLSGVDDVQQSFLMTLLEALFKTIVKPS